MEAVRFVRKASRMGWRGESAERAEGVPTRTQAVTVEGYGRRKGGV
jgi:hypothetical protein